ncbi:MAG: gamma-glutamyltransferase family protein, partial [Acetobacteraceae bacterium]|nr:gamma-glutamyltransferase family protein [Acetobacteraceae bacterium]
AEAGAAMLEAGGSAADAAVAAAFALAAAEPWNSGLGGIGFAVVAPPGAPAETLDFGPVAPARLDPAAFPLTGRPAAGDLFGWPEVEGDRNIHGPLSVVVPSAIAGYGALHARFGRLPLADVLAPAIALARAGLRADWFACLKILSAAPVLARYAESARIYLPGGLPPALPAYGAPARLPLGRLADTLERLASAGLADAASGDIAAAIAADIAEAGGVLDAADLARCAPVWRASPAIGFAGGTLAAAAGLTAAPTLFRALSLMDGALARPAPDAAFFAGLAGALRQAYAERLAGLGEARGTCTSHLSVVDRDGMAIALTTTLLSSFGSRMVLPRTGILMNNGVMWFDPRPGAANAIRPGGRPLTNMCPVVLREGGAVRLVAGASGGRRILPAVLQVLCFAARFGMGAAEAAAHPRLDVSGGEAITADPRLPPEVLEALRALGPVELQEHTVLPANYACPNLILRAADGLFEGAADLKTPGATAVAAG